MGLEPQKHCQLRPAETAKGHRVYATSLEGGFPTTKSSGQEEKDYKGISELAWAYPRQPKPQRCFSLTPKGQSKYLEDL